MDPWHYLKTWSKQRREEALQEARENYLAHPRRTLGSAGRACSRKCMERDSHSNPVPLGKDAK